MSPDSIARLHELLERISRTLSVAAGDAAQAAALLKFLPREDLTHARARPPGLWDDDRLSVTWHGAECPLGPGIPYRLFRRLARYPGHAVTVEALLDEVWGGRRSDATVRSAVRQLRARLRDSGMGALADGIRGFPGHYALHLPSVNAGGPSHRSRTEIARPSHRPDAPSPPPTTNPDVSPGIPT